MRATVIGLGAMGGSVAERLVTSGLATRVYDLDPAAIERLVAKGATACDMESATDCDVLLTSLPSDEAVASVLLDGGLVSRLDGRILIELSTVLPGTLNRVCTVAADHDVAVVDCPVSGGPNEALRGALTLLVGASDCDLDRARPVLDALGTVEHIGPPGHGKTIKLVNNVMSMGNMVIAAEAFALGSKMGLDAQRMYEVLSRSGGRSHHFVKRMPYALDRDFSARFAVYLGEKDVRLALALAHDEEYVMPATSTVHQIYEMARATGLGQEDIVAVLKLYEDWASGGGAP